MNRPANILREYGPFPDIASVHGVTYDGDRVWIATGSRLCALDPGSGQLQRSLEVEATAGTAFDGEHLFQIAGGRIQKIDPADGRVLATIPLPPGQDVSGMAWAEGRLWIGQYRNRRILEVDPETGAVLRVIEADRFVTGVTWTDGELWHGTWEDEQSELRRIDPATGQVQERLEMPRGVAVSGLEADGANRFYCGGGRSGLVRVVERPARE